MTDLLISVEEDIWHGERSFILIPNDTKYVYTSKKYNINYTTYSIIAEKYCARIASSNNIYRFWVSRQFEKLFKENKLYIKNNAEFTAKSLDDALNKIIKLLYKHNIFIIKPSQENFI